MHVTLALGSPEIVMILIGLGLLLFGAEKLPKLARSAGAAKKEFMVGQAEADIAAEQAREEARKRAAAGVPPANGAAPSDTPAGTAPSTSAPPHSN